MTISINALKNSDVVGLLSNYILVKMANIELLYSIF